MNDSKDYKTEVTNYNDTTKKPSLSILAGTGAIIFASVISCDVGASSQLNNSIENTITMYSQTTQAQASIQCTEENKKKNNRFNSYFRNAEGELFYDSDAEDDAAYYGDWDVDDDDEEEEFILW